MKQTILLILISITISAFVAQDSNARVLGASSIGGGSSSGVSGVGVGGAGATDSGSRSGSSVTSLSSGVGSSSGGGNFLSKIAVPKTPSVNPTKIVDGNGTKGGLNKGTVKTLNYDVITEMPKVMERFVGLVDNVDPSVTMVPEGNLGNGMVKERGGEVSIVAADTRTISDMAPSAGVIKQQFEISRQAQTIDPVDSFIQMDIESLMNVAIR